MKQSELNQKFGKLLDHLENDLGIVIQTTSKDYKNGIVEITGFIKMDH